MGKYFYGPQGDDGPHPSELVFPGQWMDDDLTWAAFFEDGGAPCCYCDKPADDPRFTVAIAYRRSWTTWNVGYRFAHIECFRNAMHPSHKPGQPQEAPRSVPPQEGCEQAWRRREGLQLAQCTHATIRRMVVWVDGWELERRGDVIEVGGEVEWSLVASTSPVHGYIVRTLGETVGTSFSDCLFLHYGIDEQPPLATGARVASIVARARVASIVAAYWQVEPIPGTRAVRAVEGSGVLEAVGRASGREPEQDGMGFYGYLVELTPIP